MLFWTCPDCGRQWGNDGTFSSQRAGMRCPECTAAADAALARDEAARLHPREPPAPPDSPASQLPPPSRRPPAPAPPCRTCGHARGLHAITGCDAAAGPAAICGCAEYAEPPQPARVRVHHEQPPPPSAVMIRHDGVPASYGNPPQTTITGRRPLNHGAPTACMKTCGDCAWCPPARTHGTKHACCAACAGRPGIMQSGGAACA